MIAAGGDIGGYGSEERKELFKHSSMTASINVQGTQDGHPLRSIIDPAGLCSVGLGSMTASDLVCGGET